MVKYYTLENFAGNAGFLLLFSFFFLVWLPFVLWSTKSLAFYPHIENSMARAGLRRLRDSFCYEDAISDAIYQQNNALCFPLISGCDLKWNWIHHWHSHVQSNFSHWEEKDPFQKQARYLEWGELMIADASGGGGGYTWGPLVSPVLSQKARLLRLHIRLWMPLAAIIKQSTSVVKWLCVEQNPKAYE